MFEVLMFLYGSKRFIFRFVLCMFLFVPEISIAQPWKVSAKVSNLGWKSMVYVESIQKSPGLLNTVPDTVRGTGFIISDKAKVYLVTSLSNIRSKQVSLNSNRVDSIYLSASSDGRRGGFHLKLPKGGKELANDMYLSVNQNLTIISLRNYNGVLNYLINSGIKPIPLNLIHTTIKAPNVGDTIFNSVYTSFKNEEGQRGRIAGIGISFIKSFDAKANTFVMEKAFKAGGNGSAVFLDGKVIGMMTHKLGYLSDGVVLKSTQIIAGLKELQQKKYLLKANTKN